MLNISGRRPLASGEGNQNLFEISCAQKCSRRWYLVKNDLGLLLLGVTAFGRLRLP